MRLLLIALLSLSPIPAFANEWRVASPDQTITFPVDHYVHPGFKTEWWYYTGNLETADGRRLGYQLTFFRRGLRPPGAEPSEAVFVRDWFAFGHFAVSDLDAEEFHHGQRVVRGGFGEAEFPAEGELVARIEDWTARLDGEVWVLEAAEPDFGISLRLQPVKGPVLQGEAGYSQKAAGADQASMYYSVTRLETTGTVRIGEREWEVRGLSWMDREWATNQLAEDQAGWDWFSLQADDGSDWMVYQLRKKNGETDPASKGLWWPGNGEPEVVRYPTFELEPVRWWEAPDGARYPVGWNLTMPEKGVAIRVEAALDDQELRIDPIRYWEGAVTFEGTREGAPFTGRGYLEMTGYAGALTPLAE